MAPSSSNSGFPTATRRVCAAPRRRTVVWDGAGVAPAGAAKRAFPEETRGDHFPDARRTRRARAGQRGGRTPCKSFTHSRRAI